MALSTGESFIQWIALSNLRTTGAKGLPKVHKEPILLPTLGRNEPKVTSGTHFSGVLYSIDTTNVMAHLTSSTEFGVLPLFL